MYDITLIGQAVFSFILGWMIARYYYGRKVRMLEIRCWKQALNNQRLIDQLDRVYGAVDAEEKLH